MTDGEPALPNEPDENGFPTAEDTLFDPKATRNSWATEWEREHDWYHYVNGYKDAADLLIAHLDEIGRGAYKLVPPIVFLYRHHLELAIKQLTRECAKLLGRGDDSPKSHRLDELWRICVSLLAQVSADITAAQEVQQTTRLIDEFCRADPTSEVFRYPEDKKGNPSLTCLGEVDLNRIGEVVGKISLLLECISTAMEHDAL